MPRYYYGWNIVGATLLANMLVVGATFSSFGLFVVPVSTDLGLSRANMNTALIFTNVGTAVLAPFVGRILDRFPIRLIFIACSLLLGLSLVTLGLSRSLILSGVMMAGPIAAACLGAGALTASVLVARWFVAQRGRAMALTAVGMSLGHVAIQPVIGWLIAEHGWRNALVIVGVAATAILLGLSLIIRGKPGPNDVEGVQPPAGQQAVRPPEAPQAKPAKVGMILAMPQFWFIGFGAALGMAVAQALLVTLPPLALDGGLSMAQASTLLALAGGAAIAGKLLLAVVADKFDRLTLFTGFLCMGAVMNLGLLVSEDYVFLLGCAVLLGLTTAALAPVLYALLADRFGTASFGTVRGLVAPIGAVLSAVAIRFAGEVFDRTGGYEAMFLTFVVIQLLAAALMFATRFTRPLVPAAPAAPAAA